MRERKREEERGREGEKEGGREGKEGGKGWRKGWRKEGKEGEREGEREGLTFIHTPPYIVHMHTLICTLTAAASWQEKLFKHALADLVTVDTQ